MAVAKIFDQARQSPGKIAAVSNGAACSYGDFAQFIAASRQYFARQGLPVDSVAIIDVDNLLDACVFGLALRSLGLTTVATKDAQEIPTLGLRNISCVVTSETEDQTGPRPGSTALPWRSVRVPADLQSAATPGPVPGVPETPARPGGHILMTSGTTGAHKMVLRDPAMAAIAVALNAEINGISDQSVVYVGNFGLWTTGGYGWPLMTWSRGGTVVFHQEIDLHSPLARHDMTHIFTTPATLAALLSASKGALRRNDATRLLVTGGALPRAMLATAQQFLTRQVYSVLASTEALTVAVTPLKQPDDLLWHRIHPSREVQVVDEAGAVLGPWKEGFVRVRIIDGLTGYLDDEVATRAFFHDGYFYPGDLGMFGDDGRLSLRGRASDVINVLGDKIATDPIERALQDRLGAEGVCILPVQNAHGDEEIHVVIQCSRRLERAELEVAKNAELGAIRRVPTRVVFVDKLPRNEMGKIKRLELNRQLLLERQASP